MPRTFRSYAQHVMKCSRRANIAYLSVAACGQIFSSELKESDKGMPLDMRRTPSDHNQSTSSNGNLVEQLEWLARANSWMDRPAYIVDEKTHLYREIYAGAGRAAAGFTACGLGVGNRVLLALPDSIDLVYSLLGALRAGIVAMPVNSDLHPDELRRAAEVAEPDAVVCEPELAGYFPYPLIPPGRRRVLPHPWSRRRYRDRRRRQRAPDRGRRPAHDSSGGP
ncbi:AMP-binding protein [Saccharopolyspora sp. NPDC000995]